MGAKLDEMNGDRNRTDPPAPETPLLTPGRKALLALVIVMGMMIVGGVVTIVVTIIGRIAGPETVKTEGAVLAPPAAISAPAALAPFGAWISRSGRMRRCSTPLCKAVCCWFASRSRGRRASACWCSILRRAPGSAP